MSNLIDSKLFLLTGLDPSDLAEVLSKNPRAYMALKGAVAEKHLELHLQRLAEVGSILSFRRGSGDFEKDFYISVKGRSRELAIECKNAQVISNSSPKYIKNFIKFLQMNNLADAVLPNAASLETMSTAELNEIHRKLPSNVRESGLERYKFSEFVCRLKGVDFEREDTSNYLKLFKEYPISIDFQRTRNSRDEASTDSKKNRFYRIDEIDVVAACLFSRTLDWNFIFCHAHKLPRHKSFQDRYTNNLRINPEDWNKDLTACINEFLKQKAS